MQPIHLRMARAALGWSVRDLEAKSGVGRNTISRYEAGKEIVASSLQTLERVLSRQGVVFLEADDTSGPGIRLKHSK